MKRISKYEISCEKVKTFQVSERTDEYGLIDQSIGTSEKVGYLIMDTLGSDGWMQERFMVFALDVKLKIVGFSEISKGSLDTALVHPRDVFQVAISIPKCAAILIAHNHPSGDPEPSQEDLRLTKRLCDAGELLGIKVVDHVIVGDGKFVSLNATGRM